MPAPLNTICAHNATGQALVPGRPTTCRQCGAQLQPSPAATAASGLRPVDAAYPADGNPNDLAYSFAQ